ncbi:MAG: hypothetical protein ACXVCG_19080 [Bdellovibrionota bacterium]
MSREPIRIPIARLQSARTLARELFLRMPRNQKMIRIVNSGDEHRGALLARLQSTPDAEVLAIPLEGDPTDPAAFPLYVVDLTQSEQAEGSSGEPLDEAAAEAVTAASSVGEIGQAAAAQDEPAPASVEAAIAAAASPGSDEAQIPAQIAEPSAETTVAPDVAEAETSQAFSADETPPEEEERLEAGEDEEPARASFTGDDSTEDFAQTFSADAPARRDDTKRTFQKSKEEGRELHFSKTAPKAGEDADENTTTIPAGPLNSPEQIQVVSERLSGVVEEFAAVAAHIEEEARLAASLDKAAATFEAFSQAPESLDADSRERLRLELKICLDEIKTREKEGSDMPEVLRALRDSLAMVAGAMLSDGPARADLPDLAALSSHFSGFVQEFKAATGGIDAKAAESLTRNLEKTAANLEQFSAGKIPADEQAVQSLRQDLTGCLEEIRTQETSGSPLATELAVVKDTIAQALNALPFTSRGARAYRETPQIAGRMATLLAYSLGYVSATYLHDVALATSIFFTVKNGVAVDTGALPEMSRAAIASERGAATAPLEDSLAIIDFLDIYFESPDCDRTQKDFLRRTFDSALGALSGGSREVNEWNVARWKTFLDKGPSISALSVCSKASSKANKSVKELTANAS